MGTSTPLLLAAAAGIFTATILVVLLEDFCFLQIVTAHRGGEFTAGEAMRFGSLQSAIAEGERLQAEFDADAEPRRVYVLDFRRMPVWAGGARGIAPARALAQPREKRHRAASGLKSQ